MSHPATKSHPAPSSGVRSGFVFPAEWLPHAATWCSWPRNADTWSKNLGDAQNEFVGLVRAIAADEPCMVMAGPGKDFEAATKRLGGTPGVEIVPIQTNDAWARDYAPTFVVDYQAKKLSAVDWHYNAWGGKYPPFDDDQKVTGKVAKHLGCGHQPIDLCLEGGALEVDEWGLLLCTRSCAMDEHRNPGLSPETIEQRIECPLNIRETVWLSGDAIIGDDTDGHIDQLARFTPGGAILYAWSEDPSDPQLVGLNQNLNDLREGLQKLGRRDQLVSLPIPSAPVMMFGNRIPACYCNFYLTNHSVLVPAFGDRNDERARAILAEHFPGRRAISLPSVHLTVGLGSFHCLTQQQPVV